MKRNGVEKLEKVKDVQWNRNKTQEIGYMKIKWHSNDRSHLVKNIMYKLNQKTSLYIVYLEHCILWLLNLRALTDTKK